MHNIEETGENLICEEQTRLGLIQLNQSTPGNYLSAQFHVQADAHPVTFSTARYGDPAQIPGPAAATLDDYFGRLAAFPPDPLPRLSNRELLDLALEERRKRTQQ